MSLPWAPWFLGHIEGTGTVVVVDVVESKWWVVMVLAEYGRKFGEEEPLMRGKFGLRIFFPLRAKSRVLELYGGGRPRGPNVFVRWGPCPLRRLKGSPRFCPEVRKRGHVLGF